MNKEPDYYITIFNLNMMQKLSSLKHTPTRTACLRESGAEYISLTFYPNFFYIYADINMNGFW